MGTPEERANEPSVPAGAARVPRSWKQWVYSGSDAAVTPRGAEVLEWAIEEVSGFYSDEWFAAAVDRFDCPVFNMWEMSFGNPGAVTRFVERAARIALLPRHLHESL